ncbi:MAG TPA: penicillin-binding transpeptidase domain-containing protein [Micromonosporaceae bacterium]
MRPRYPLPTRSIRNRPIALLASVLTAAALLTACLGDNGPEKTVDAFLADWRSDEIHEIGFLTPAGEKIPANRVAAEIKELSGELEPPTLRRNGAVRVDGDIATAKLDIEWSLPGDIAWQYDSELRLHRGDDDRWQVIWEPRVLHEQLIGGDRLSLVRLRPQRAPVLDAAGQPIVTSRPVVVVGVQPSEVTDTAGLVRELDAAFKAIRPAINPPVDLSDLPDRMAQARPDMFVEVVTLREADYQQIKPRIYDLPGTRFRAERRELAPSREFARALLGTVGPVLKEDIERDPDRYAAGDSVGHGGLQEAYDKRLRGTVGVSVVISRKGPDGKFALTDTEVFRHEPKAGSPLRTTLDPRVQLAADEALNTQSRRSALVAIRISDGAILAAANGPHGGSQNLAFTAQVPPGSTFKIVTTLALLDKGVVAPDTPVACPRTFTVAGRSFRNADDFELGTVPFRVDFAKSCNTAFTALAPHLGDDGLRAAARRLGLEGDWNVGLEAFTGKVSTGGSPAEQAAASFGQGTTLVSPLAMAAATAAVARGRWQPPRLLIDPDAGKAGSVEALPLRSAAPLRSLMRDVVTAGTATALRDAPGGPVYGKTGTAEYDDNPEHTHAWFVGWQGDIAFAVFVEQGGSGSKTAVPIAQHFLRGLHR